MSDTSGYDQNMQQELEKIQAYRKALEQEFGGDLDPNDPANIANARRQLLVLIPEAGETIRRLMVHAQSESVRANLAKYVFDQAMKDAAAGKADDETQKLLKELGLVDA